MWKVQGLNIVSSWAVTGLAAAIDTTIRTAESPIGNPGAQYSLAGVATGTSYGNPAGDLIWDGTTDTAHNYTVTSGGGSAVIKMDLDWTNPVVLFALGSGYDSLGVTYDPTNDSLWVSKWNGGSTVSNYKFNGTLLSSFDTGSYDIGGLAYDAADDTLWLTHYADSNIYQYDKSGNLLQSGTIAGLGTSMWSGEIVETAFTATGTPEPGSMLLLATGGALMAMLRRRVRA
jgi:hypothetical protein